MSDANDGRWDADELAEIDAREEAERLQESMGDDGRLGLRDIALWTCEQRSITDLTPQRAGPNSGSFASKALCDTDDGQELLRGMVNA